MGAGTDRSPALSTFGTIIVSKFFPCNCFPSHDQLQKSSIPVELKGYTTTLKSSNASPVSTALTLTPTSFTPPGLGRFKASLIMCLAVGFWAAVTASSRSYVCLRRKGRKKRRKKDWLISFSVFYISGKGRVRFRSCMAGAVEAIEGLG